MRLVTLIRKLLLWVCTLGVASIMLDCQPGKSLDSTVQNPSSSDTGKIAVITIGSAPTSVLPTDTGSVQIMITDSSGGAALKGAKISITSTQFSILSATSASALNIDSVPGDGKISFRIFSSTPGAATVSVTVTSGNKQRTVSIPILVTEKPVAPKVLETFPQKMAPKETTLVTFQIVDSVQEKPLPNAVVTLSSPFFGLYDAKTADTSSFDTTGADGKVGFRLLSQAAGTGTIQVKIKTAAGISRTVNYTLTVTEGQGVDRPRKMVFTAMRSTLRADGSDSTSMEVLIKDDNNNPLSGEKISFTSTGGVVRAEAVTDSWGRALTTLISERVNKDVVVTATLEKTGATAQQTVSFDGVNITISPSKRVLMQSNADSVLFELKDGADVPMSGDSLEVVVHGAFKGFDQKGVDSMIVVTDTRGHFKTNLTSSTAQDVIITARALGARAQDTITFTNNTLSLATNNSSIVGDGAATATLTATLKNGAGNAITNGELRWTTTFGGFTTTPFTTTNGSGQSSIILKSPLGSGLAIVNVEADTIASGGRRVLLASGNITVPITALKVQRLELRVTPDNIPVKVGETKLIAQAFDSSNNVMTGVLVSFRMIRGAGGGDEVISPPVDYTKAGQAEAVLKAGGVISLYRGVKLAAVALDISGKDTLVIASSDTVGLTISGPPDRVSIGVNILKGINPDDGTFALPTAAVVTDVNGNLVADGTPVNFSTTPIGAFYFGISWHATTDWPYYALGDTVAYFLPWTDYNNNKKLDADEEVSQWDLTRSRPARGEDQDGNGVINFPPETFIDINGNGVWDSTNAEPLIQAPPTDTTNRKLWVDFNKNGIRDTVEPFFDYNHDGKCECAGTRDANGNLYEVSYFGSTANHPFPGEVSVGIQREVSTSAGKATTQIWYVQSLATKVKVRITAESNGIQSFVDVVLPIVKSDK